MGRDASSSPHALLPSAELQALAALRWGVAARGSLCRLPADHALLSSPLPGASPVLGPEPGVLPTLALVQNTRCGQGAWASSSQRGAGLGACPSRVLLLPCVPGGHSLSSLLAGVKKHVVKLPSSKSEQYSDGALLGVGGVV